MPDLQNDIVGQVERIPLRPSESNALLPLYEAVSNSLHAITERFGDDNFSEKGRIDIEILRAGTGTFNGSVDGFRVSDNGIGLNDINFTSFCTPFTRHKITRGGKGIGRLSWLKIFRNIDVFSTYKNVDDFACRSFDFILRDQNQIALKEVNATERMDSGTTVVMKGYRDAFGTRCPANTETIVQRIIAHFLPIFAGDKSPSMFLHDGQIVDLREKFMENVNSRIENLLDIEIDGESQPIIIRHMKCNKSIRPRGSMNNWICFCANDRGVKEYGIDEQIGLKSLDGEHIYVGAVTGDYLDSHVNTQRTDFIFEPEEGRAIRRQVAASVKEFLNKYVEAVLARKKEITKNIITKHPQYLYINDEIDMFVDSLQANSTGEEQIYVEMAQHRYRRQRRFNGVRQAIDSASNYTRAVEEKVCEYKEYILEDKKGSLAEYVIKRKAVLDLLDKLRGFDEADQEKHHLEEAIHSLICPMRIESGELHIEDHNLWILDDRLAFFNFFASDKRIQDYTESESSRRPDISFFYDSCVAWRESERSCDTVILVEFKRPGLDEYTDRNDPFIQLMDYVTLFKSSKTVRDRKGNVISGIGSSTAFQCYIVADVTEGLHKRLRGKVEPTPDGKGLFGYTRHPDSYVEVIPYDKLLLDAQARNAVFFKKLGLNG